MSERFLVLIQAAKIQDYIFGSNELMQNIGASELIARATEDWVFEALETNQVTRNVTPGEYAEIQMPFVDDALDTQVVYAGGGRALTIWRDREKARAFIRTLTRHVLLCAPGLALNVVTEKILWDAETLQTALDRAGHALERRAFNHTFSTPLSGLGVTAACAFTGLPAVGIDPYDDRYSDKEIERKRLISNVVRAKLDAFKRQADKRLNALLEAEREGLSFVYDFDLLGTKDKSSYLAVIHTDGNRMGERFRDLSKNLKEPKQNPEHAQALYLLSESIRKAATAALQVTVKRLMDGRVDDGSDKPERNDRLLFGGVVPMPKKKKIDENGEEYYEYYIPFRPIVFGGDDVTFVCDGRLGLSLAHIYLDAYASAKLGDDKPAYARAGVAVVKTHFPFSRAYQLADALCESAKEYIQARRAAPDGESDVTALDWHFAVNGLVRDLDAIRAREYTTRDGQLYLRPYRLSDSQKDPARAWTTFVGALKHFRSETWEKHRNKRCALRDTLRAGPKPTEQFLKLNRELTLPKIPERAEMETQGWHGQACGYYDALEALDFYVALESEAGNGKH